MKKFAVKGTAVLVNFAFSINVLFADLPPETFESVEWDPYGVVGWGDQAGWEMISGDAYVSAYGAGYGGGQAIHIPAAVEESRLRRSVPWNVNEKTAFIDVQIKPSADPVGRLSTFYVNGTQLAFQVENGATTGNVWVYHGEDGATDEGATPRQWIKTAGSFSLNSEGIAADSYVRVTMRHDYQRNLWDLFVNGKLAAANLAFEGRGTNLESIEFYGSDVGDTLIDNLSAQTTNMLFPDADKDGLEDSWEIANGSNPNVYDRDSIKAGTGKSFLDLYMAEKWGTGAGVNGGLSVPIAGTIPPLTIDAHTPVTSLKGAFSVGSDGSANYSIPIDLPKGTAGMEPQLSLSYSSAGGNGIMGLGWSLGGLQRITRGPATVGKDGFHDPVDFDSNDRFFLDGQRLICVSGTYGAAGSVYKTEIDSFARITAVGAGPSSWKVETKAGLTMLLGATADSKLVADNGPLAWCVSKVSDTLGNYYSIEYARDSSFPNFDFVNHRVSRLRYTGFENGSVTKAPYCSVEFSYETRDDAVAASSPHSGSRMGKRLSKIRVLTGSYINYSYRFAYENTFQSRRSILTSITKHIKDSDAADHKVKPTTFTYDGLKKPAEGSETNPLWENSGSNILPVYSEGVDASGEVNSMVSLEGGGDTAIRLTGNVSKAYVLNPAITLHADSRIRFEFLSAGLSKGAFIGLDNDLQYSSNANIYRIGGTGNVDMGNGNFSGTPRIYDTPGEWKTFALPIGELGTGARKHLVLMCIDDDISNGVESAAFRNIKIFREGTSHTTVEPISFDLSTSLPRYFSSDGKDLGIRSLDLNSDGLVDLADWRVANYTFPSSGAVIPQTYGYAYRNEGDGFMRLNAIRPPTFLPLSTRESDGYGYEYGMKHDLLAQSTDIDGDGNIDLMGAVNIGTTSGYIKNEFAFYSLVDGAWVEKTGWRLPFYLDNTSSSESRGGKRRHQHFQWTDLNGDGYMDLIIHTTAHGNLRNPANNGLLTGPNTGIAYLNRGANGPGWIRTTARALPDPLTEDQKDVGRRLVDIDGDGFMEVVEASDMLGTVPGKTYRMNGTSGYLWNSDPGVQNPPNYRYDLPSQASFTSTSNKSHGLQLLDLNGDGLPDLMQRKLGSASRVWINRGGKGTTPWDSVAALPAGETSPESYSLPFPLTFDHNGEQKPFGYELADLNGDGLVDILYSNYSDSSRPGPNNAVLMNTGTGWVQRSAMGTPGETRIFTSLDDAQKGKRRIKVEDMNGDGFPDLITGLLSGSAKVWYNKCKPEVLKTVTDGFGSEIRIDYRSLSDPTPTAGFGARVYVKGTETIPYGHSKIIDGRPVVSRYSEPDGKGGRRYTSQRYGDLRYDRINEASLGFGWTEVMDERNGQISRTETSRTFPFGGSPTLIQNKVRIAESDLGSLGQHQGVTPGTKTLSSTTVSYQELASQSGVGGTIRRPVEGTSQVSKYELSGTLISRITTTQQFDSMGFVTSSTATALDGSVTTSNNNYSHVTDSSRWHLGRLSSGTVVKSGGGKPSITKTSSFTYDSATGLLKTETVQPGHPLSSSKTYTYDIHGNVTQTSVTASGQTRSGVTGYDSQGRFLISETNSLGHMVRYGYDTLNALIGSITDIQGKTTWNEYDLFGTKIRTHHPDGTISAESTGYITTAPSAIASQITNPVKYFRSTQTSGSPVNKVYLDALGRDLATETTILGDASLSGNAKYRTVYSVKRYDNLGRVTHVSDSFAAGGTPNYTVIAYDMLSRELSTVRPGGNTDRIVFFQTETIGGQPTSKTIAMTGKGQILERWENQHGQMARSRDGSGQLTEFSYDQEGRILNVSVGGKLLLTNTWDVLGNKTSVWEANSGITSMQYNGFGELINITNPRSEATTYTYDQLGRQKTLTRPGGEGTFTFFYDNARGAGLGKLWSVAALGYLETYSYDDLGRVRNTTTRRVGEVFSNSVTYDVLGRVVSSTDAGGLTVFNEYDVGNSGHTQSFLVKSTLGPGVPGAGTVLWQAGTYDVNGRTLTQTLAQGVTNASTYHPGTGRLASLSSKLADQTLVQNKAYNWEVTGQLKDREDKISYRKETFMYSLDGLGILYRSTVQATAGATNITVPAQADYYHQTNGNLIGKPGAELTYDINSSRPHAVTSATIKGVSRTFGYDAAGFVTSDGVRTYNWTSFGQLASLTYLSAPALQTFGGVEIFAPAEVRSDFSFDVSGHRMRQLKQRFATDGSIKSEETLYLGSYEREVHGTRSSSGSALLVSKTVHRHTLGNGAVYVRTVPRASAPEVKLTTVVSDHLGSTDALVTSSWNGSSFVGSSVERQSYDAWGERRDPNTFVIYRTAATQAYRGSETDYKRGYTNHEQLDDSGLIHMNGRIYDPELGRMLSPDPYVQVPEYSQNFNRYSYVLNDPINLTDPSGYSWLGDVFHKMGNWVKENWRTVVAVAVVVVAAFVAPYMVSSFYAAAGMVTTPAVFQAGVGLVAGSLAGAANAAISGGNMGDILRGAAVGGIQGAISGGILRGMEGTATNFVDKAIHTAGHGVVGGASNAAMGGKFQDGFLSSAAGAGANWSGIYAISVNLGVTGRAIISGVIGGTAASLGGGKFSNGAYSAAFQHLIEYGASYSSSEQSRGGEWIFPEGGSQDLRDYKRGITNGILGNRDDFVRRVNDLSVPGYYNPSHGFISDVLESGFQKFFGWAGDPLTDGFARRMGSVTNSFEIVAHSQGTLTVTNAAIFYGSVPSGSTLELRSPAITFGRAIIADHVVGGQMKYIQPYGDGANLWAPSLNPVKWASGLSDIPRGFRTHTANGL